MITGPFGVGKTWLACALLQSACRDGMSVLYQRTPRRFDDLEMAHGDGRSLRLFKSPATDLGRLGSKPPERQSAPRSNGIRLRTLSGGPDFFHLPIARLNLARRDGRAHLRRRHLGSLGAQRLPPRTERRVL